MLSSLRIYKYMASFPMDDYISLNVESGFYSKYNENSLKCAIDQHNIALYTFVKGFFRF